MLVKEPMAVVLGSLTHVFSILYTYNMVFTDLDLGYILNPEGWFLIPVRYYLQAEILGKLSKVYSNSSSDQWLLSVW